MNKFFTVIQLLLIQLRCLFGLHKWKYEGNEYEYINEYTTAWECAAIAECFKMKEPIRECSCCQRKQKLDIHCLGLKPPKFVIEWNNC